MKFKLILSPEQIDKYFNPALWVLFLSNIGIFLGAFLETFTHNFILMDISFYIEMIVGILFLVSIQIQIFQED